MLVDTLREYAQLLPDTGRDLVELIGLDATLSLVEALGGSTFPVPHRKNPEGEKRHSLLEKLCGEVAALELCKRYGGTKLYVPNCKKALIRIRNIGMIHEFVERKAAGESANSIIADMAPRYKLADRNIWHIVNKTTVAEWSLIPEPDGEQLSLI